MVGKTSKHGQSSCGVWSKSANVPDEIYATRDKTCAILGMKTATQLGLIERGSNASSKVDAVSKSLTEQEIKEEFGFVFDGELGQYPGSYRIMLTKDATPKINVPRRVPHKLIVPLQRKLEEMVKQGVIEEVEHPTDWVNSIMYGEKRWQCSFVSRSKRTKQIYQKRAFYNPNVSTDCCKVRETVLLYNR